MRERGPVARALEWIASLLLPRRFSMSITRGRFQLRNGPWRFSKATDRALDVVLDITANGDDMAVDRIARGGNGAATRQPGSAFGYATALTIALKIVQLGAPARASLGPLGPGRLL